MGERKYLTFAHEKINVFSGIHLAAGLTYIYTKQQKHTKHKNNPLQNIQMGVYSTYRL
jgi:hypothetical protein